MQFKNFFTDIQLFIVAQYQNMLTFIVFILLTWMIQKYLVNWILKKIVQYYDNRQQEIKKEIWEQINKPIRHLAFSTGFLITLSYTINVSLWTFEPLLLLFKTIVFFYLFQGVYYLVSYFGKHPEIIKNSINYKAELILFPFFARILRVMIIFIGFAVIMKVWDYDINGLVAGLGIGGLAISLGAKDSLSHIFAGIMMAIDKPFAIGDLISTDSNLEGYVEDMNFRSTRIRTLDKALVSVPNAVIANQYIYNWTRRQNRRVRFFIGVNHTIEEQLLKETISEIKDVINNHPHVEEDTVTVAFDSYTSNSLEILILYITDTSDFKEFMLIKEELNYEIRKILETKQVKIALPAQNIHLQKEFIKKDLSDNQNFINS